MLFSLFVWFAVFIFLGVIGAPFAEKLIHHSLDRGSGAGRLIALLIWGYVFWIVPSLAPVSPNATWAIFSLGITVGISEGFRRYQKLPFQRGGMLLEGFLFVVVSVICIWIRSYAPQANENEQLMNFMIFQSLHLAKSFPPADSWFAGYPMNYYYFGQLLFVPVSKISGASVEYTFNFALCTVLPITGAFFYSFYSSQFRRRTFAAALSIGAIFGGTAVTAYRLLWPTEHFSWIETAQTISRTVTEVPLFSLFIGHLHAHFISFPVTCLAALAIAKLSNQSDPPSVRRTATCGALVGIHSAMNPWAIPPLLLLALICWFPRFVQKPYDFSTIKSRAMVILLFLVSFRLIALPFTWHYVPPPLQLGFVDRSLRSEPFQFFLHWSQFLIPFALVVLYGAARWSWKRQLVCYSVTLVSVALLGGTIGFIVFLFFAIAWRAGTRDFELNLWIALLLVLGVCEFVYFKEDFRGYISPLPRFNTVFKFHFVAWAFALLSVPWLWKSLSTWGKWVTAMLWAIAMLFLPATLMTRDTEPTPTLDSLAWLKAFQPDDARALDWMRTSTHPSDRIVEAVTYATPRFSILSTLSGRSDVLGLVGHEKLWRSHQFPEIVERENEVRELYQTNDPKRFTELIQKLQVAFIVYGGRERAVYGELSKPIEGLDEAYHSETVQIYRTGRP